MIEVSGIVGVSSLIRSSANLHDSEVTTVALVDADRLLKFYLKNLSEFDLEKGMLVCSTREIELNLAKPIQERGRLDLNSYVGYGVIFAEVAGNSMSLATLAGELKFRFETIAAKVFE